MSQYDDDILIELECLVCKEYMPPPIQQCTAGHNMCSVCFKAVTTCPTCRGPLGTARNFALENIISKIQVPCKYKTTGCFEVKTGSVIRLHEEFCQYGEVPCPLKDSTKCTWTGKPKDIINHAKENHEQHPRVVNNADARIKNFSQRIGEGKYFQLVDAYNKIFKYCVNISYTTNVIEWNVLFVGPREDAANYMYIIKFIDKNQEKEKFSILSTCQKLVADSLAFTQGTTCTVHFEKLKTFCGEDMSLNFHFQIMSTKDLEGNITSILDEEVAVLS